MSASGSGDEAGEDGFVETPKKNTESEKQRAERQAAALRANLRRRNAQRRGRTTSNSDSGPERETE